TCALPISDPMRASPLVPVERTAERGDVVSEALHLLHGGAGRTPGEIDLVVCAHGRRDVCCGGDGTRLARALAADSPEGRRWWTSSHQGGHRFAPTMLTLPDGSPWGQLDTETARGIVDRSLDPETAAAHHRGCTNFGEKELMALDTTAFRNAGWRWMDAGRRGRQLDGNRWRVDGVDDISVDGLVAVGA